jgi:sugar phosphate isomerase/epimerase
VHIDPSAPIDLTYCTNIHPADGWTSVLANLRRYAPPLKARLAPDRPFGIGLRLSAREAAELRSSHTLDAFRAFLDEAGLYVAIINGFPYGPFHGTTIKEAVYAPDWRHRARVDYTLDLLHILTVLLPPELDGGISTVPISYKAWMGDGTTADWTAIVRNLTDVALAIHRAREERGRLVHLDIEPEPDCVIETTDETVAFFEQRLLTEGVRVLAPALGGPEAAERVLRDHVRVCFDCCHVSVEHEDPIAALRRLSAAGIAVGRVQLSSALRVDMPRDPDIAAAVSARLSPFADATYLHQVICRHDDRRLEHAPDLDSALAAVMPGEWRVHFHVPLFRDDYDGLRSTQQDVRRVLAEARRAPFTHHLEIETYTWDVLPSGLKADLLDSIAREYEWVFAQWPRETGA